MLFESGIITRGSGSFGGLTLSHNAGGMYLRARVTPTNPDTAAQQDVRSAVADLVNRWAEDLSAAQRDAWNSYAFNVPLTGPLGDPRQVSGINMYVRGNVGRTQAGLARAEDAPVAHNLGGFTTLTTPTVAATGSLHGFAFDNTDAWANEDDSAMLVYVGRPLNKTRNFFRGPYQYAGMVEGDAITPPTSPASIAGPFTIIANQRVFFRAVVSRSDGRLSNSQKMFAEAS